jgi:hypothetical protein
MSGARFRWAGIALAAVLAQSCVVAPGPVGVEGVAPGYGVDYYDPPAVYGGWGVGFDVAARRGRGAAWWGRRRRAWRRRKALRQRTEDRGRESGAGIPLTLPLLR